jgi:hypothetical protein
MVSKLEHAAAHWTSARTVANEGAFIRDFFAHFRQKAALHAVEEALLYRDRKIKPVENIVNEETRSVVEFDHHLT